MQRKEKIKTGLGIQGVVQRCLSVLLTCLAIVLSTVGPAYKHVAQVQHRIGIHNARDKGDLLEI